MKFDKFTDVYPSYPQSYKRLHIFHFSTYIFSADITPDMLKLCRVTKVKVLFLVLVYVFNFHLFEFSAAILEKGLLRPASPRGRNFSRSLARVARLL